MESCGINNTAVFIIQYFDVLVFILDYLRSLFSVSPCCPLQVVLENGHSESSGFVYFIFQECHEGPNDKVGILGKRSPAQVCEGLLTVSSCSVS